MNKSIIKLFCSPYILNITKLVMKYEFKEFYFIVNEIENKSNIEIYHFTLM